MKILFATMQFGRGYRQGTERYLADLGAALGRAGHETVVLAGDPLRRGPLLPLGAVVERDPPVLAYPTRGWTAVRGLAPRHFAPLLDEIAPDVVHVANPAHIGLGLTEACVLRGVPYVITTMDLWWVCPKATLVHSSGRICEGNRPWRDCARCVAGDSPAARLPAWVLGGAIAVRGLLRSASVQDVRLWFRRAEAISACLEKAGHVIFPSAATEDAVRPLIRHARHSRIGYGLDARWFAPPAQERVSRREPPVIGFAGAIAAHKAPHLLLEALHRLGWRDAAVRLAGPETDAEYSRRVRDLAAGLAAEFLGPLPPDRMPDFLRSLDVLVVPSVWPENAPYVVLESLAVGTPVLASRVRGIADLVVDADALFEVQSPSSLADALRRWRSSPPRRPDTRVRTADEMAEQTLEVYRKLL